MKKYRIALLVLLASVFSAVPWGFGAESTPGDSSKPVKVFIMMGQSNMLGFGRIEPADQKGTLAHLVKEGKYPYLVELNEEGSIKVDEKGRIQWEERKDVRYVHVMESRGNMRVVKNQWLAPAGKHIGPELQFGHVIGDVLDNPVLLLKTCIGNRSLGWDLLPPGSESFKWTDPKDGKTYVYAGYKQSPLRWEEGTEPEPISWYAGKQYDDDVANAKKVLANLEEYYPDYKGQGYKIAGFVWWQGHKDQNPAHAGRYEQNLVNLIKALRKDFNAPDAPFAIATIGFGGWDLKEPGLTVANAQLAVSDPKKHPEFAGTVKTIESRKYWKPKDESPSGAGYHYNHNAETYMNVGNDLGQAMAELLKDSASKTR